MDRSTTPPPEAAIHEINPDKLPTYIGAAEQAIVTRKSLGAHSLSNTSTAQASSETVIGILATIAKQERVRLAERTRAGLERVRREGKRLGRPTARVDAAAIRALRASGASWSEIARNTGLSRGTVQKVCRVASDG